ncbi:MAG TPA: GAF domain-containing protein, partial [Phototrophicaceae bacterium]|nr:GAF domain-containing protein [Phototrophicaceae bacterium]
MVNFLRRPGLLARFHNMPIGRRLSFIVVGISIITLIIVVYIALISTTFTLRSEANDTYIRQNNNIATALDRRLQSVYILLHDRLVPTLADVYEPGISITTMRDQVLAVTRLENNLLLQRLMIYIPDQPIAVLNFANQDGGNILARGIQASRATPDTWFVKAYENKQYNKWFGMQSDVLETPTNQLASLVLPLVNSTGDVVGLISGDISPSTLNGLLRDTIAIQGDPTTGTANGYSMMVDGTGNAVIATYNTRLRQPTLLGLSQINFKQSTVSDVQGVFPNEEDGFAISSPATNVGWYFITVLPDAALPALPYNTVLQIIAVSAIGLIALIWSVNRFVGATVARPAFSLSAAAASIGGGNLSYKIPFHLQEQHDEIGTMARALEDMRLNLEMLYNTLEQRVMERTAQLDIARQEAQSNAGELRAVYDESLSVVNDYQLQPILNNLVQRILSLLNADYCGVWLRRRTNDQELRLVIHTHSDASLSNTIVKLGEGLAGTVALNATPLLVDHYSRFPNRLNLPNVASIERALCVPLMSSGETIGAVMTGRPADGKPFTENDQRLMTLFANLVAPVIRNAQLFQDLDTARDEADRANQVKTRFLASVTHELRTPLNLIINNMDFMRIGAFGEVVDEQVQRLDQTIRSAEHLLYLINDLLDVSKIEAGEMQLFI